MKEDMINEILLKIAGIPGVVKAKGGLVPLPPGNADAREGLVLHCLCKQPSVTLADDLLSWLRNQALQIIKILHHSGYGRDISMMSVTVRLRERGENLIVYGCDVTGDQFEVDDPDRIIRKEWSHDDTIGEILGR